MNNLYTFRATIYTSLDLADIQPHFMRVKHDGNTKHIETNPINLGDVKECLSRLTHKSVLILSASINLSI